MRKEVGRKVPCQKEGNEMYDLILAAVLAVVPIDRPVVKVFVERRPLRTAIVQIEVGERERRQIFRGLFERFRQRRGR